MISKHTRKARSFKKFYLAVSFEGKTYCPFDEPTGCILTSASRASGVGRGDEVLVLPAGTDRLGRALVAVTTEHGTETWKEHQVPGGRPEPPQCPCLVNVLTGERTYGAPGEDPEHLFERLHS